MATTIWLLTYIFRSRRLMLELREAIAAKRCMLAENSAADIRWFGMSELIDETNEFIEQHRSSATQNLGYTKQIELMLRAVQEVVVIFDSNRVIEYSNRAAELLFNNGKSMQNLRVDTSMRSLGLLEFFEKEPSESPDGDNQISIEKEGRVLWFEASCNQVRSISQPREMSSLLVLHDITRLKSLEVMRREFVANVSHELRTPLTIIKGFAEALVDDHEELPVEMRARYLTKVLKNAERLHMLVEDLLTLSRLESKSNEFDPVVQPLQSLLEDVREDYHSRLEAGQEILLEYKKDLPDVAFDRFRIHQVLDNLVSNVFRYAPQFTKLRLRLEHDESSHVLVCSVYDDGPGIPASNLEHIFERFYRVDKGRSQERGGTGLGLSIVKHIIQMHGGEVFAESKLGEWTEMGFRIPCVELDNKMLVADA
ncbi:MAG: sensor histidine kinase [Opitutaceae bacterium]